MPALPQHQEDSFNSTTETPGKHPQQRARLADDPLPVRQVAGLVVRHGDRRIEWPDSRRPAPDLPEPLVHVAELGESQACALSRVSGIVGEQRPVAAQVRAASAGVADDRVVALRRQQVDHPAGQLARAVQVAVVRVQRAAARLERRRLDDAAVGQQHIGRITIHVRIDEILHAARQQRHSILRG